MWPTFYKRSFCLIFFFSFVCYFLAMCWVCMFDFSISINLPFGIFVLWLTEFCLWNIPLWIPDTILSILIDSWSEHAANIDAAITNTHTKKLIYFILQTLVALVTWLNWTHFCWRLNINLLFLLFRLFVLPASCIVLFPLRADLLAHTLSSTRSN